MLKITVYLHLDVARLWRGCRAGLSHLQEDSATTGDMLYSHCTEASFHFRQPTAFLIGRNDSSVVKQLNF